MIASGTLSFCTCFLQCRIPASFLLRAAQASYTSKEPRSRRQFIHHWLLCQLLSGAGEFFQCICKLFKGRLNPGQTVTDGGGSSSIRHDEIEEREEGTRFKAGERQGCRTPPVSARPAVQS
ncbi:hypothetical protein B0H16DRAFT_1471304 [Mycena metata]|uniref:Uncharacterized protein n=1 Tax=Mycena metata TaxID=1033252 RepID=A0AAD7HRK4_9AGAR|nr:hypothetical protein B0H16DRAFT_1471304 [Mycena metata]